MRPGREAHTVRALFVAAGPRSGGWQGEGESYKLRIEN